MSPTTVEVAIVGAFFLLFMTTNNLKFKKSDYICKL